MEGTNLRQRNNSLSEGGNYVDNEERMQNERTDEYKENSRNAKASNLYTDEIDTRNNKRDAIQSAKYEYRPAAGRETNDSRPVTRRLHDSHFLIGNQTYLHENDNEHVPPNQKFHDRYANRSLEGTNVGETAVHSIEEGLEIENQAAEAAEAADVRENYEDNEEYADQVKTETDDVDNGQDQTDRAYAKEQEKIEEHERYEKSSMRDNASADSRQDGEEQHQQQDEQIRELQLSERNEQRDIDREIGNKASAGRSDHRHFESEKSLPWMRMIPGDKNLSEQMFLYLTHNELKGQIQDLEKRENQASMKHQWDEALRLRDMRNRLDLARERNLYRRDDLMLDPEVKKLGMAGIEARQILLKEREELCTNSSMYSEEAKVLWDKWVVEDRTSILENARHQREDLMNQLEENWRSLAIEDKQRITDSFKDKEIAHITIQNDHDNASTFRPASR